MEAYNRSMMRRRIRQIIDKSEELVADIQWWNENRGDAPPFDVGKDLVRISAAKEILLLIDSGKIVPPDLIRNLCGG